MVVSIPSLQVHINKMNSGHLNFAECEMNSRADLVRFYGYSLEEAAKLSDDDVFHILDEIADPSFESDEVLPEHLKHHESCSCGKKYKIDYVDCESRGDGEIYYLVCPSCKGTKTVFNNYAYMDGWDD